MGLDLGSKTLGIAMSDALGMMAHGVETFTFKENHFQHAIDHLILLIEVEKIRQVVLGLPKHMNNDEGERALMSRRFAKKLTDQANVEVILWDERMTTMQAARVLTMGGVHRKNQKTHVDKLAATLILQSYLDAHM